MWKKRSLELMAMMMIGDGVLAAVDPSRHLRLWTRGPGPWRRMMKAFVDRPGLTRLLGVAEAGAGLALAARQRPG